MCKPGRKLVPDDVLPGDLKFGEATTKILLKAAHLEVMSVDCGTEEEKKDTDNLKIDYPIKVTVLQFRDIVSLLKYK